MGFSYLPLPPQIVIYYLREIFCLVVHPQMATAARGGQAEAKSVELHPHLPYW